MNQKTLTLWEVAVLALLREAPMHPYQMQRLLSERHKDELLVLKRGSLYHAINRLLAAELIEASQVGRDGRRPERTTYKITAAGRQELIDSLRQMVAVPRQESSDFMAAMSFVLHLDQGDAVQRLEEREQRLRDEVKAIEARLESASERVDRIHLIESEYLLALRQAELKWTSNLIGELRAGSLGWDATKIFREVQGEREAAGAEDKEV
jgi:DNA-binding PadR family transcriptional regulator